MQRWLRMGLLAVLAYWTIRVTGDAGRGCFLDLVNLAFHEAGHLALIPFGSTMHYLGGSLGQLAVPGLLVWYFLAARQEPFAAACCAWWIGESLVNIAVYMADARSLTLPLVGGGDHDWNELFYRFGLLGQDSVATVSSLTSGLGLVVMLLGMAWAACFVLPEPLKEAIRGGFAARAPALARLID